MFRKVFLITTLLVLTGCVDLGKVGSNPGMEEVDFSASLLRVSDCLSVSAFQHQLMLREDDPLPGGIRRFNLYNQQSTVVAWIDMIASGDQTSVTYYFGKNDQPSQAALSAMMNRCQQYFSS